MINQQTLNELFEAALQDQTDYTGWEPKRSEPLSRADEEPGEWKGRPANMFFDMGMSPPSDEGQFAA